jgi:hypothetical protein
LAQKKAKIGRPKLPKGEAKGKIVPVRFTADDLKAIQRFARGDKKTTSQVMRDLVSHRERSRSTYQSMESLIHKIRRRADDNKDLETYEMADNLMFLLRNYSGQQFDIQQAILPSE